MAAAAVFRLDGSSTGTGRIHVQEARSASVPARRLDRSGVGPAGRTPGVPESGAAGRPARRRPRLAHDDRGEGHAVQQHVCAIPRLQIPAYNWWSEALHGVANQGIATVFPQAIGLAATFDEPLIHRIATAISTEARAKFHEYQRRGQAAPASGASLPGSGMGVRPGPAGLDYWSPNINIFRDPRWGRGQETYGEDPFLAGRLGTAFVRGLQGDDPKYFKTIATPEALRRAQRPRAGAAHDRREGLPARHGGHLPPGVPPDGGRRQGVLGDVRLQPHQRRARLREYVPARGHAARRLEVQRLRGVGLRRHRRHQPQPQVRPDPRGSRGGVAQARAPTSTAAPTRRPTPPPSTRD